MELSLFMDKISEGNDLAVTLTGAVEVDLHLCSADTRINGEILEVEGQNQAIRIPVKKIEKAEDLGDMQILILTNGNSICFSCFG